MRATVLTAIERRPRPPRRGRIFKPRCEAVSKSCCREIFHTERRDFGTSVGTGCSEQSVMFEDSRACVRALRRLEKFRGLIVKHDRHAQNRTSLLTWLSIMGTGWHVRYAWSCVVCLHRELVILLTSLCRAHRVALFNRTGLRVIVTQEFAKIGFVRMTEGFCSVVKVNL